MRVWLTRIIAVLALAGAGVAIYVAITSVEGNNEVTAEEATEAMGRLASANTTLSSALDVLRPGASPRTAQEAVRSAVALSRELEEELGSVGDNLSRRVHVVVVAQLAYLDAIGSVLNNPRSPLRGRIGERAITLREVLQQIPGGAPRAISGGAELVAYSKARVGDG